MLDVDREKKTIPPTLGFVMLICFWRYFALPAISIAIVYGFRNGLPLKAFSHDPVFVSWIRFGSKKIVHRANLCSEHVYRPTCWPVSSSRPQTFLGT
jgi:hypothetical protein